MSPAPNKIHALPVMVTYQIPSTSQTFSAVFTSPQQVYVHPSTGASGDEETFGSIYLKTVVQGILMSSPELAPTSSEQPDLSIYILDPRETFLRRGRDRTSFGHLRSGARSSSPCGPPVGSSSSSSEVWSGKGLISWALEEPGQGKNLITGRIIQSPEFTHISRTDIPPLQALAMAYLENGEDEAGDWGIHINLSLRGSVGNGSSSKLVMADSATTTTSRTDVFQRSATSSHRSALVDISHTQHNPNLPHHHHHPHIPNSASLSKTPSTAKTTTGTHKNKSTSGKKKRSSATRDRLAQMDSNRLPPSRPSLSRKNTATSISKRSDGDSSGSESFPSDIPAALYTKPDSLTKEQAQRLLASPAFLNMLERVTGGVIDNTKIDQLKRKAEEDKASTITPAVPSSVIKHKRNRIDPGSAITSGDQELKCYHCGRTKSAVWRSKTMDDGKAVRVCNACGLYWNKLRVMRPPHLWENDDNTTQKGKRRKTSITNGSSPAPRISSSPAPTPGQASAGPSSGFKRTLSTVAELDAQRIAMRQQQQSQNKPKSNLSRTMVKTAPATSPVRPLRSNTIITSAQNANNIAASSPGWAAEQLPTIPQSEGFQPIQEESPNTIMRQFLDTSGIQFDSNAAIQSLQLPLSDDAQMGNTNVNRNQVDMSQPNGGAGGWTTDLSAFFDVDAFLLEHEATINTAAAGAGGTTRTHGRSPTPETTDFHRALSSGTKRRREATLNNPRGGAQQSTDGIDDDDVLSQLFHRTSSSVGFGLNGGSSSPGNSSSNKFDFSTLPPSSPPPVIPSTDFSNWLSSPNEFEGNGNDTDNSQTPFTMDFSPMESVVGAGRISPEKGKSGLQFSFTANTTLGTQGNGNESRGTMDGGEGSFTIEDMEKLLKEHEGLWSLTGMEVEGSGSGSGHEHGQSSSAQTEEMMGDNNGDFMALLKGL